MELTGSYAPLDWTLGGADLAIRMLAAGAKVPEGLTATPFMDNAFGLVLAPALAGTDAPRRPGVLFAPFGLGRLGGGVPAYRSPPRRRSSSTISRP